MNAVVGLILIALSAATIADDIEFKICKRSDPAVHECLINAITDAVIKLKAGSKSYKILPLEPLRVNSISIGGNEGSVSLKQDYKNIEIHGLTKRIEIRKLTTDWNKLIFTLDAYNPRVDFVGDYKIDGKILLLPIRGHGRSNITMVGLKTNCKILFEKFSKKGETYLKVKQFKVKFSPSKVLLKFENLFDGNADLAKPMEKFLDENADLLFKELQAPYETSFGLVFAQIGNELFNRVPFNEIIPE